MIISCTSCRRKKIKCNRLKPVCLSCKARNYRPDQCVYSDRPNKLPDEDMQDSEFCAAESPVSVTLVGQLAKAKERRMLLEDYGQTHDKHDPGFLQKKIELLNHENQLLGQMCGQKVQEEKSEILANEVLVSLLEKINLSLLHSERFKANRTIHFGPTCFRSTIAANENFATIYKHISKATTKDRRKFKNQQYHLSITSYFQWDVDKYFDSNIGGTLDTLGLHGTKRIENLLEDLISYLPNYAAILYQLNLFFQLRLDNLFPFIDRHYLGEIVREVFQPMAPVAGRNDFCIVVKDELRYRDYSRVALVLSIMKVTLLFTDLSFDSIHPDLPNDKRCKIDSLLAYFTLQFLGLSRFLKRPMILTLQTFLFLKVNMIYNLNEGEGGDSSDGHQLNCIAYNMAVMCGLHRNIAELYLDFSKDYIVMLQNTWRYILYLDWKQAFDLGYPLLIDEMTFSDGITNNVFALYKSERGILEINQQFAILQSKVAEDIDVIFHDYFIPIVRSLTYQLNSVESKNLSVFSLEIYIQNFIKFYSNSSLFQPLFESLANPIIQANQLPKNQSNFFRFIKRIKLQCFLIDIIFTLYNIILTVLSKTTGNFQLKWFYRNQVVNIVIFIVKSTKKFLEVKTKELVFEIYLYPSFKRIIHRSSSFLYSDLLFQYGKLVLPTVDNFGMQKSSKVFNIAENINQIANPLSIYRFSEKDFELICFNQNQYPLVQLSVAGQMKNFQDFINNKYTYYNFYNQKLELTNLIFELFFKNFGKKLQNFYGFYVLFKISAAFYSYLKDRNLVRSEIQIADKNHKSDGSANNRAPQLPTNVAGANLDSNFMNQNSSFSNFNDDLNNVSLNKTPPDDQELIYDPLKILSDEFYIDIEVLLNQIALQY